MGKVITFLLVFFGVLLALRLWSVHQSKQTKRDEAAETDKPPPNAKSPEPPEPLLRCVRCHAYIPRSELAYAPTGLQCQSGTCKPKAP